MPLQSICKKNFKFEMNSMNDYFFECFLKLLDFYNTEELAQLFQKSLDHLKKLSINYEQHCLRINHKYYYEVY